MAAVEAMLQKGVCAIKHAIINYLNQSNQPPDSLAVSAITRSETPLTIRWANVQAGFVAAMKITAHQRYYWWLQHFVFRGQKRSYDTDSDSESDNQVPPPSPTPDDTVTQQSETSQPEDIGDHFPASKHSVSPQASSSSRRSGRLACRSESARGQKIETASDGQATTVKNHRRRVTKRRVTGK